MLGRCIALAALLVGCGARTPLEVEPCADAGTRACENACGAGVQACVDGRWQPCEVPPIERACTDACGAGTQVCVAGVWQPCEVPPTTRACEATCGAGTQRCVDGEWERCEGPATAERACMNACGAGTQRCADDAWGPCEVEPVERGCSTPCGEGTQVCADGAWGPCSAERGRPPVLSVIVRDFRASHPDFEAAIGDDRGIVEDSLGPDGKPVYAGITPTTHGREAFDQWYRDVPGVNVATAIDLDLRPSAADPSLFVYDDLEFFPVDGALFGNEGREHNFHFTLEAQTAFVYQGGEIFRFRGDDDVFVFINRRLAIDLGGVHGTQEATVDLDAMRDELGLVLGERYPLHLFFAERHTSQSTFTVETTIAETIRCE